LTIFVSSFATSVPTFVLLRLLFEHIVVQHSYTPTFNRSGQPYFLGAPVNKKASSCINDHFYIMNPAPQKSTLLRRRRRRTIQKMCLNGEDWKNIIDPMKIRCDPIPKDYPFQQGGNARFSRKYNGYGGINIENHDMGLYIARTHDGLGREANDRVRA